MRFRKCTWLSIWKSHRQYWFLFRLQRIKWYRCFWAARLRLSNIDEWKSCQSDWNYRFARIEVNGGGWSTLSRWGRFNLNAVLATKGRFIWNIWIDWTSFDELTWYLNHFGKTGSNKKGVRTTHFRIVHKILSEKRSVQYLNSRIFRTPFCLVFIFMNFSEQTFHTAFLSA